MILHGDCIETMAKLPENSVDAIVTDPPYGLGFMGKGWDALPPGKEWAEACLRVLKPGGHLLAFGGTRTWHRLAVAIEDAGFEMRDSIAWMYGSGFPKSLDVSKAIDKARDDRAEVLTVTSWLAAQRDTAGSSNRAIDEHFGTAGMAGHWTSTKSQPAVPKWDQWLKLKELLSLPDDMDAEVWRLNGRKGTPGEAWQTAEVVRDVEAFGIGGNGAYGGHAEGARLVEKSANSAAAKQWDGWGTALKPAFEPIVVARKPLVGTVAGNVQEYGTGALNIDACRIEGPGAEAGRLRPGGGSAHSDSMAGPLDPNVRPPSPAGRWPANVVLDEYTAGLLDEQSGTLTSGNRRSGTYLGIGYQGSDATEYPAVTGDSGGASRFFYCAKAPKKERPQVDGKGHPTVKPVTLMRWLVKLVTPPGGVVLDPFLGSGTTAEACELEGFQWIGIEREAEYVALSEARLKEVV